MLNDPASFVFVMKVDLETALIVYDFCISSRLYISKSLNIIYGSFLAFFFMI